MSDRIPQVLRVYLMRPWVWFMGAMALVQVLPPVALSRNGIGKTPTVVLPELRTPDDAVTSSQLLDRAAAGTVAAIRALDLSEQTAALFPLGPFRVVPAGPGRMIEPVGGPAEVPVTPFDGLGVLNHTPSLQWLRADFRMFMSDSLRRLGNLSELETLSLRSSGSVDTAALKTAHDDLPAALARLPRLKELDLRTAFGMQYRLPPLPNLEYVSLGPKLHLEDDLKTLADHSPKLSAIVLSGYPQFELTGSMRESLGRTRNLRTVYLHDIPELETVRQALRQAVPGVSFPRTTYLPGRVFGALYLMLGAMFPMMIVWVQTLVSFSLPLSRTLPGFARPHLAVPAAVAAMIFAVGMGVAVWLGIHPLMAVALLASGIGITFNPQPVVDLTPAGTFIARAIVAWRVTLIGLLILMAFAMQPTLDAALMGEFPWIPCILIVAELLAGTWVIRRLFRQACVLAEQGQNVLPGMVNVDHFALADPSVARKSGRSRSLVHWADLLLERLVDQPRPSLWALLRGGNARIVWYARGGIVLFLVVIFGLIVGPRIGNTFEDRITKMIPFFCFQAGMLFVCWTFVQWIGRRNTLASEFIRPVSRDAYFRGLWWAMAVDLGQVLGTLLVVISVVLASTKSAPGYWGAILVGATGAFLVLHGFLMWILTARRLWVPLVAGFGAVTIGVPVLVFLAAILQPGGTNTPGPFTPLAMLGATLALNALGVAMQIWQRSRCNTLELG